MVSFGKLAKKIFGDANERALKSYDARVEAINALEDEFRQSSPTPICRPKRMNSASASRAAKLSMIYCQKPLQPFAKPPSEPWSSATMMCSWWAAWCCMRARSPR